MMVWWPKRVPNKLNNKNIVVFEKNIYIYIYKGKGLPRQVEVAQRVPGRLRPRIFLTFRHYKGGRPTAKRTGRLYPPE